MPSSTVTTFPPTLAEAESRIRAVRPVEYARTRNHLQGAVTGLSAYITHGVVTLPQVLAGVASEHTIHVQHKFVQELGWREYCQHVWQHKGDGIFESFHAGPLPDSAYSTELPADIRNAQTGVPAIDHAVRSLYRTGYLHNHARMWLASYTVHLRKIHWVVGADWMYAHLLDGDLASNHLSWQWIAGTASSKPYLFNAENVARFAPSEWHSSGTVLDTSYEALDVIARNTNPVAHMEQAYRAQRTGDDASLHQHEPALLSEPPQPLSGPRPSLDGRDIWLVHPWNVRNPHASLANDCVIVGWWPEEFFSRRRWSAARWSFVGQAMSAITTQQYFCNSATLQQALTGARRVHTYDNSHISSLLPTNIERLAAPRLFADVDHLCHSFSSWWKHVTHGIKQLTELPGFDTE